jgi:hypothetical protein
MVEESDSEDEGDDEGDDDEEEEEGEKGEGKVVQDVSFLFSKGTRLLPHLLTTHLAVLN